MSAQLCMICNGRVARRKSLSISVNIQQRKQWVTRMIDELLKVIIHSRLSDESSFAQYLNSRQEGKWRLPNQ